MSDGIHDTNAGRYRGTDPEIARLAREVQHLAQTFRMDPIYKISSLLTIVGSYKAIPLYGHPTADGLVAADSHYGMYTDTTNSAKLLINTMESPTNAAHALSVGMIIIGGRRLHYNNQDAIFVSMPPNAFSGTNGGVTIDVGTDGPGGGGDGGGGDGPGGGGGGGGGGDPGGGGDDGTCPLIKAVAISGVGNPDYDTSWNCIWDGSQWTSAPGGGGLVVSVIRSTSVVYGGTRWMVNTTGIAWSIDSNTTCPADGTYHYDNGTFIPGSTATVT